MSANSENSEKTNVENKAETEIKPAESVIKDEKPAFVDINKVVEPEKPKEKPVSTKEVKEINIKSEIKTENDGKRTESKKKGALFWAGVSIGVVGTIFAVTYLVMRIRKAMTEAKGENGEMIESNCRINQGD